VKAIPEKPTAIGELRPSQMLYTFGIGAVVDLPNVSAIVMGLDDWTPDVGTEGISEKRLLDAVRRRLGPQVAHLITPPVPPGGAGFTQTLDERNRGVPVAPFPQFLRCPVCELLTPISGGLVELKVDRFRPDRTAFVHLNCARAQVNPPRMVPARFLLACENGHLDDFPWHRFVHRGAEDCASQFTLRDYGATGAAVDIQVECTKCGKKRRMSDAFDKDRFPPEMATCGGRHPHLRRREPCSAKPEAMLLGATNAWFSVTESLLTIPSTTDPIVEAVAGWWSTAKDLESAGEVRTMRKTGNLPAALAAFDDAAIFAAIQTFAVHGKGEDPTDLHGPEYTLLVAADPAMNTGDFHLNRLMPSVPDGFEAVVEQVVLVERLRVVTAAMGFTRISAVRAFGSTEAAAGTIAPLSRTPPKFVPAGENRGEGIFIQFKAAKLAAWRDAISKTRQADFERAYARWKGARNIQPPGPAFPGMVYLLLHSLSHALMRQLTVECGYPAASVRERLYVREIDGDITMAGILLYTAAPDAEGTLGGLVRLGRREQLGRILRGALDAMRLCASDPLCAEHSPDEDHMATLHGAACHACLLSPETSCENGNQFLDRLLLVATLHSDDLAFFELEPWS
jgi:hypothetical protein